MKRNRHTLFHIAVYAALALVSVISLFPALFMFINSLMSSKEVLKSYGSIFSTGTQLEFHLIPEHVSLQGYLDVFLMTPAYLVKFWISLLVTASIVAGQVIVSCLSGYGFSKFQFPGKNLLFFLVIILMMMPVQVLLATQYLVIDWMGLTGSYFSLILPGWFATFGIFLMTQIFSGVPDDLIAAAKIDRMNQFQILTYVMVPSGKAGISSLVILSFIDNWNMVEQPLVFLKDYLKYPLSIFLSFVNELNPGVAFVCGVLVIIPVLILFLYLKDALVEGIENSNLV